MKPLHYVVILFNFITIPSYGVQAYGTLIREIITTNMTERDPLDYVSDEQSYTSGIGGIVFVYPASFFTQPPIVQLSILQNVAHPNTETYVAEISANSTASTTVMVYKVSGGVVSEAPTGVITVCLLAIDDPV